MRLKCIVMLEGSWQQVYTVAKLKHVKDFELKDGVEWTRLIKPSGNLTYHGAEMIVDKNGTRKFVSTSAFLFRSKQC